MTRRAAESYGLLCVLAGRWKLNRPPGSTARLVGEALKNARIIQTVARHDANGMVLSKQYRSKAQLAEGRLLALVGELFGPGVKVDTSGDPRGHVVKLYGLPGNPTNDFGGEGFGLCAE